MAWLLRAPGPVACAVQAAPSHSHTSARSRPALCPPTRTVRPRRMSYASAGHCRGGGVVAGVICVQVVPSHSHVVAALLLSVVNITMRSRAKSYAIAWRALGNGLLAG